MIPRLTRENVLLVESRLRQFRKDYNFYRAPVDSFELIRIIQKAGIIDLEWETTALLSDAFDAQAKWFEKVQCYWILSGECRQGWKNHSPTRRCNFTMAHELGHIFLGHLAVPEIVKSNETLILEDLEADAFAAKLLMPKEVFGMFCTVKEAADALWVSETAARRRQLDTGILLRRRTCPRCGFSRVPASARYCRECGQKMSEGPDPEEPPAIEFLPPRRWKCILCNDPIPFDTNICAFCKTPAWNICVPEDNLPRHHVSDDAKFCDVCGAQTVYSKIFSML